MTPEQEAHLAHIKRVFVEMLDYKYRDGQARHGGNLFDLTVEQLLDEAIQEALDQATYLITMKQKLSTGEPLTHLLKRV